MFAVRFRSRRIAHRRFGGIRPGDVAVRCLAAFIPPGGFAKRALAAFAIFVIAAALGTVPLEGARDLKARVRFAVAKDYDVGQEVRKVMSHLSAERLGRGIQTVRSALRTVREAVSGLPGETMPVTGGQDSRVPEKAPDGGGKTAERIGALLLPVEGEVTSRFGWRKDPVSRKEVLHEGIDFAVKEGTFVKSAAAGTVKAVRNDEEYGKVVEIDHAGGLSTLYAHNSEVLVKPGIRVVQGQPIAKSGRSGKATAPHLHFEVRMNGIAVDPGPWLGIGETATK